jgi:hypothetical protein
MEHGGTWNKARSIFSNLLKINKTKKNFHTSLQSNPELDPIILKRIEALLYVFNKQCRAAA